MKKIFLISLGLVSASLIVFTSCKSSDPEPQIPVPQNIVTADSSGFTGGLTVYFFCMNGNLRVPNNVSVQLYASHNDLITSKSNSNVDLAIYSINSGSGNVVNFGFIIQGNYYMYASVLDGQTHYSLESVVQVLPQRYNRRNMTLYPTTNSSFAVAEQGRQLQVIK